jgi:hypothetical protein
MIRRRLWGEAGVNVQEGCECETIVALKMVPEKRCQGRANRAFEAAIIIRCGEVFDSRKDLGSGMLRASCFMQARRMIEAQVLVHMAPHDDAHDLLARRDGGG